MGFGSAVDGQMGSSYLLAHGLGTPVKDAVTDVTFPSGGTYRVWVRARDWVAPGTRLTLRENPNY
ncbi:hypothetical protein Q31b_55650 [Novipirellula aureliae]|uniref:Uncharacterized protein n=1 Tax=Novipirellula aureliae TaxID=2527966 RepID=A0A5C6DDW7_9BACT|nr:hypothetical protein Q31b_55650 [Novipirellula aureliae]